MIPLVGYADRLSVRPDETISFHVAHHPTNTTELEKVLVEVVRVISADPHENPGPGIQMEAMDATVDCIREPGPCESQLGSHAEIPLSGDFLCNFAKSGMAFTATIMPTFRGNRQTIASCYDLFDFYLDKKGHLCASVGSCNAVCVCSTQEMPMSEWATVFFQFDAATKSLSVGWNMLGDNFDRVCHYESTMIDVTIDTDTNNESRLLVFAARQSLNGGLMGYHFNGRIEHPRIWTAAFETLKESNRNSDVAVIQDKILSIPPDAAWDFGLDITTQRIQDTGPHGLHGKLVNSPTRAVRGSNWTGREMCWRHAPEEYAAIHFHDTDMSDCEWPVCYQWKIPSNLKSGNYALLLQAGEHKDNIPFFVVPPKGKRQADLAVLISTFTYVIYGNHAMSEYREDADWRAKWRQQVQEPNGYPHNPCDHPEYGWSTYNTHTDGAGVCLASWHRPLLNLRIGYVTFPFPEVNGSGLRHFPADTHLTAWLEAQGITYDVITDWELHTEGSDVLKPYRVVTTGSHPEYHSESSLQALSDYRRQGGRLMYLGGNGFYWKIAVGDNLLEIRRGEGGIRAWASDPGEYYHQLDGQYGGLWRRNGRAPQALVGVGFSAQGNFVGSHYKVKPLARANPRTAWIFEGIAEDEIGKHGLSGHGAAGFELDRTDTALGTPSHAVVLASSVGHDPNGPWVLVFEERLSHLVNLVGVDNDELIRADLSFFETPSGGAVFSTGSITYCGSLLTNDCRNDVSLLTRNVLLKLLDPRSEFVVPEQGEK